MPTFGPLHSIEVLQIRNGKPHGMCYGIVSLQSCTCQFMLLINYLGGAIDLPVESLPLLNKSAATDYLKSPSDMGHGYAVTLEFRHQLHCLVRIPYSATRHFKPRPPLLRNHFKLTRRSRIPSDSGHILRTTVGTMEAYLHSSPRLVI